MKLRRKRESWPEIIIIPMIDIMFFLLVFFMLSTMFMTEVRTVPVKLPNLTESQIANDTALAISINDKNEVYVGDKKVPVADVGQYAREALRKDPNAYIVLRTDENSSYGNFSEVVQSLKKNGVGRFGIATEAGE